MSRIFITLLLWFGSVATILSQTSPEETKMLNQAAEWFEAGQFAQAFQSYSQLVSLHPQDPDLNFRFGTCALYSGEDKEKAIKHLTFAIKKGCSDARVYFYLGKAHHLNYNFAEARFNYKIYQTKLSAKDKNPLPVELNLRMCDQGSALLKNIRDIVVLEKTQSSEADFFRYFNLEEIGGKIIVAPTELLTKYDQKANLVSLVHFPGNSSTVYFTSYGKDGSSGKDIYRADLLPGGTFSTPERLSGSINTPFDEDFAYMHPDGKTFYFASKGHNSMGGYDIFKSNYDFSTNAFSEPENLDFAINTPDDDVFYVVDSLKQTAYFASGRSSAQNELHVYKVMVRSIPVKSLFIQGDYFSEVLNVGERAKITVKDELTSKVVYEANVTQGEDAYVMDLPKGGLYSLEVKPEGGTIIHKAVFEAPVLEESSAFGQQLKLVTEENKEKLIVVNNFETPLNTDLTALAANMLRKKAGLEVNNDEETLKLLDNQEEEVLSNELTVDNLPGMAGFGDGRSASQIAADRKNEATNDIAYAESAKAKAALLLNQAALNSSKANEIMEEVEGMMAGVDKTDVTNYVAKLKLYNEKLAKATELQIAAENALETAEYLNQDAELKLKSAAIKVDQASKVNTALAANDLQKSLDILNEIYASASAEKIESGVIAEMTLLADQQEKEQKLLSEKIINLRDEESLIETKIRQNQNELERAVKKNVVAQLNSEKEILNAQLNDTREKIIDIDSRLTAAGNQEQKTRSQITLFNEAVATVEKPTSNVTYSKKRAEELNLKINETGERLTVLEITDAETLGLIDEYELASAPSKSAQPIASAALSNSLKTTYASKLGAIDMTSPTAAAKNQALASMALMDAEKELQRLKSADRTALTAEESANIDNEISNIESFKSEILSKVDITDSNDVAPANEATAKTTTQTFFPELNLVNNGKDELERVAQQSENRRVSAELIEKKLAENNAYILESDDVAEIDALEKENEQLIAASKFFTAKNELQVTDAQTAYEASRKEVIDGNLSYEEKLREQIRLTEKYSEMLSAITPESIANPAEKQKLESQKAMSATKLENYYSDLDLVVSAGQEPNTSNSASLNSLPENDMMAIAQIYPDYDKELVAAEKLSGIEQEAEVQRIKEELTSRAEAEMEKRTAAIDQTSDEAEKQQYQLEIMQLERIGGIERTERLESVVELALVAKPVEPANINNLNENTEMIALETELQKIDSYAENSVKLQNSQAEIERLEDLMKAADSNREQKKIDSQIEKQYFERSQAEALTTRAINFAAEEKFNAAANDIRIRLNENRVAWADNDILSTHFAIEQNRSRNLMAAAKLTREEAAPEIDEVRQAHEYRQAAGMQLEALAIQTRLNNLIDRLPELSDMSDEELTALLSGDTLKQELAQTEETLAENVEAESTEESTVSIESVETNSEVEESTVSNESIETTAEAEEATVPSETASVVETTEAPVDVRMAEMQNLKTALPATLELDLKAIELSAEAEEVMNYETLWAEVYNLNAAEISTIGNRDEIKSVNAQREKLVFATSNYRAALQVRNDEAARMQQVIDKIASAEQRYDASSDQAEKAEIVEELSVLYAEAEVINVKLKSAEEALASNEVVVVNESEALTQMMIMLDAAEIVEETRTNDVTLAAERSTADTETTTAPVANVIPETIAALPEESAAPENYATSNRFEDYLFKFPKQLTAEVFAFTDKAAYDSKQPIPINPVLPEGLVYKVQVGAFRKSLPANHFDQFAPLSGEKLENGITRYTAGLFLKFNSANEAKTAIRKKGYSDAFVVAFMNGRRISLTEARKLIEQSAPGTTSEDAVAATITNAKTGNATTTTGGSANDSKPAAATTVPAKPAAVLPAIATDWTTAAGEYYTVQIGVYSKPVALKDMYGLNEIMAERLSNGLVRYTTGRFTSLKEAEAQKAKARGAGIKDAFITAYANGKKVAPASINPSASSSTTTRWQVEIGTFTGEVPSNVIEALLAFEQKWGIIQLQNNGAVTYVTGVLKSNTEAQQAVNDFKGLGINSATVKSLD
ncbi:MAG: hypothetical protein GC193_07605 [Cryomorphaceae bacterium]|nr:hypothetical protein [Cryomorphaceae bacterium]